MTDGAEYYRFAKTRIKSSRNFTDSTIFIFCNLCPSAPGFRDFDKVNALPSVTFGIARRETLAINGKEAGQTHRNAEHKPDNPL